LGAGLRRRRAGERRRRLWRWRRLRRRWRRRLRRRWRRRFRRRRRSVLLRNRQQLYQSQWFGRAVSGRTRFEPRVTSSKLSGGGSEHAAAEDLRERPGLGLDDKLDAKDFPAADRGGAKRAWLAALMV